MIHKTFSFLFIAIFFLIFCLSSTTSCTRLLQARRAIMADDDNGDYNQDNNNNDDDYNDASSPAIPPEYVGIPMRPHSSKPDHSATDQHPPPAVIHPPPGKILSNIYLSYFFLIFHSIFCIYIKI
uniref:Transmembrane protein n=1 Tax=Solanum lycopersicum TaxID=4081 RepID=K4BXH8_SOLLC